MRYLIIPLLLLFPSVALADPPVWGCSGAVDLSGNPECGLGYWRTHCEVYVVSGSCGPVFELLRPSVSNVLFLPGIKGTRLYKDGARLWQPRGSEDVQNLFLTEDGRSTDPAVYAQAGDLLSEVLGQSFYTSFLTNLEEKRVDGTYGPNWLWESGAYDWRLSLTDLIERGARYDNRIYFSEANGMPYLERLLRDLAEDSETGKVTIVAHSNGGLVAKALMQSLGEEAGTLVDQMIFVGVPQSGAPRAIAAGLFGYGEALPFDSCATSLASRLCTLLVDRETARTFAEHSPMTYHLLPSLPYFSEVSGTGRAPVTWAGHHHYASERLAYGSALDTVSELHDFLAAHDGGRTKPDASDLSHGNVMSEGLLAYANTVHTSLDAWMPPAGVAVHQIAGTGRETFSGIEFYEEPGLIGLPKARYRPLFTDRGDGIVPNESAAMMSGTSIYTYWIDLFENEYSHADLFEFAGVQELIDNILTHALDLPTGIATTLPEPRTEKRLLFILHSPLTLGVTDRNGKYTGISKDGAVHQERSDIEYGVFGETQYISAPDDEPYTVILEGTGTGIFSLDIQERVGDVVGTTTTIGNVPVTPETIATLHVPELVADMSDLTVDTDSDGVIDVRLRPEPGGAVEFGTSESLSVGGTDHENRVWRNLNVPTHTGPHIENLHYATSSKDVHEIDTPAVEEVESSSLTSESNAGINESGFKWYWRVLAALVTLLTLMSYGWYTTKHQRVRRRGRRQAR